MSDVDRGRIAPGGDGRRRPPLRVLLDEGSQTQRTLFAALLVVVAVTLGVIVFSVLSGFSSRPLFVAAIFIEWGAIIGIWGLAAAVRRTSKS